MERSRIRIFLISVILLVSVSAPVNHARGITNLKQGEPIKPPDAIQGGIWRDDFWIGQFQEAENIDVQVGYLVLKFKEQLHWTQTWTAHFAEGDFFHTEAISDSVRLAWDDLQQDYYPTGIYTSTVFSAGRSVDWAYSEWRYLGIPDSIAIQFRTGDTHSPDQTWTGWMVPIKGNFDYCAFTLPLENTDCFTTMRGINSSPYIQYRALFSRANLSSTVALYDIDFLYGIHILSGDALSILIPPEDLREWENVIITSTIPTNTSLIIDILAPDGSLLIPDVKNGTSLAGIDSHDYPAIQLRASLATSDESISPDIDLWGIRWLVWNRQYLPVMLR